MAIISVSLPSDGTNADVADVNTPITTIVNAINGNLDASNLSNSSISTAKLQDASVTNAKLATTSGEIGGAWTTYTPTFTNLTVGNGTLTASYKQIGKLVYVRLSLLFGSTSAVSGDVEFTLPATAATYTSGLVPVGNAELFDASFPRIFQGYTSIMSTTKAHIRAYAADQTFLYHFPLASNAPMVWTTSDGIGTQFFYEAA